MDIEQLKLILETVESMGGDAKEFGIWWMVCDTLPGLIVGVVAAIGCAWIVSLTYRLIKSLNESERGIIRIADELGFSVKRGSEWSESCTQKMVNAVKKLHEERDHEKAKADTLLRELNER